MEISSSQQELQSNTLHQTIDSFELLSDGVKEYIFTFLPYDTIPPLCLSCKFFKSICDKESFWESLCEIYKIVKTEETWKRSFRFFFEWRFSKEYAFPTLELSPDCRTVKHVRDLKKFFVPITLNKQLPNKGIFTIHLKLKNTNTVSGNNTGFSVICKQLFQHLVSINYFNSKFTSGHALNWIGNFSYEETIGSFQCAYFGNGYVHIPETSKVFFENAEPYLNDEVGMELDRINGTITFFKNGKAMAKIGNVDKELYLLLGLVQNEFTITSVTWRE